MQFALIIDGKIRELHDTQPVYADTLDVRQVSDDVQLGWLVGEDGGISEPVIVVPAPDYAAVALAALNNTLNVIVYFYEMGLSVPDDWATYRTALRAIRVSGELPEGGWPTAPEKPDGI